MSIVRRSFLLCILLSLNLVGIVFLGTVQYSRHSWYHGFESGVTYGRLAEVLNNDQPIFPSSAHIWHAYELYRLHNQPADDDPTAGYNIWF